MPTAYDRIADSYITSDKEVKGLFAPPKPPPISTVFTDYYQEKQKKAEPSIKPPFLYPRSADEAEANRKAFQEYRKQGGSLLADQWRRQAALEQAEAFGIPKEDVYRRLSGYEPLRQKEPLKLPTKIQPAVEVPVAISMAARGKPLFPISEGRPSMKWQPATTEEMLANLRRISRKRVEGNPLFAQFMAGVGDVISSGGSALQFLGKKSEAVNTEDFGKDAARLGQSISSGIKPVDLGDISWKSAIDPQFWQKVPSFAARMTPFTLSLIPAAIVGYLGGTAIGAGLGLSALWSAVLGTVGGAALSRPLEGLMEAGNTYDEALQRGMNEKEADKAATSVFLKNLTLAGMDAAELAAAFLPLPGSTESMILRAARGAGGIVGTAGLEAGEEVIQEQFQASALGEPFSIFSPQAKQAAFGGGLMGGAMGGTGAVVTMLQSRVTEAAPQGLVQKFDRDVATARRKGLNEQEAGLFALNEMAKTPRGKAVIEQATRWVEGNFQFEPSPGVQAVQAGRAELQPITPVTPEVTELVSARNEIQRELEYAQKRVLELRQALKEKGGTREKRIWNNNELARNNTLVAEYGRLLRENNPEELVRYIPKPLPPTARVAPEVTKELQAEYTKRMKPFLDKVDTEIKKVNDDFMAGRTSLAKNQTQRDAINVELDKQANKIRREMGFPEAITPTTRVTPEVTIPTFKTRVWNVKGEPVDIPIQGRKVVIPNFEEFDLFLHKEAFLSAGEAKFSNRYHVSEITTGLKITPEASTTQREAIAKATETLNKKGIEIVRKAISQAGKVTPTAPITPEVTGAIPVTPPPIKPPLPPVIEPLEPVPPSGRARTLLDLNREAKGMRAFSPEDRAAIMDVDRPIKEDELLYKVKPFSEHANNLLQPDTPVRAAFRSIPGLKQIAGLWTPAQMQRNNPVAMIGTQKAIFEEIEVGRARLATLNWWHDADELFKFRKIKGKWRATDIQLSTSAETSKPYHATIHDLIEHPENYIFTSEQERILQIAQDMQTQILRDAQRTGVDAVELTGDYWRRIVIKAPQDKMFGGKVKTQITSRKGYTRQRVFDFVDDGAKLGFEYETHPLTALQNRLEAGIRTISDQNTRQAMAKLPGVVKPLERLESRYPQTVEGAKTARQARDVAKQTFLRNKTVENETALRQAEADYISAMRELFIKKIEAGQPNIGELKLPNGKIAPAELVEEVRKWIDLPEIATGKGSITSPVLAVTQLLRSTLTNVDLAAGFIQGQALFYRNNPAWWRSQGNAIVSLIDDPTAYVAKNFDLMDEGMRMGAISIPTEFMFTRQGLASIPTRIPVIGPVMKSFNRAFEWFILTGQTELYRATRSGVIKRIEGEVTEQKSIEALVSLGSAIRKELGTESYALLGVRPTQHTIEQLSLFAARFFRALTGIQAQAFTGGEGGREARRAMGALIAGGTALTIAASWITEKKMPNMSDPFNPDWMQFEIGKTRFNAFGPFYPYFRTQARVSVYMLQGKPVEAAKEIKRFFQSKAGIPFRAIDMAAQFAMYGSYRTFEGKTLPFTPLGVGEAVLGEMAVPISIQEAIRALPQGRPEAVVGEVFGLVGREKYPWFPRETFDIYNDIPTDEIERKAKYQSAKTPEERAKYALNRTSYRKANPEVEAKMFITGRVNTISSVSAIYSVLRLIKENKIDPSTIRGVIVKREEIAKREKLGVRDTDIDETDRLILLIDRMTPLTPENKQWEEIKSSLGVLGLNGLNKLWYSGGSLTTEENLQLADTFRKFPLGEKDFNIWIRQTLRQVYENSLQGSAK